MLSQLLSNTGSIRFNTSILRSHYFRGNSSSTWLLSVHKIIRGGSFVPRPGNKAGNKAGNKGTRLGMRPLGTRLPGTRPPGMRPGMRPETRAGT